MRSKLFKNLAAILTAVLSIGVVQICQPAYAGDANYIMAIVNDTHSDIVVSIDPWDGGGEHSSCIDLASGTAFSADFVIAPHGTRYIGFWRSGRCHGKQGWLALRASGDDIRKLASDDDFQQFWFDADGGFSKHGTNSGYPNRLDTFKDRVFGDSVRLVFHISKL